MKAVNFGRKGRKTWGVMVTTIKITCDGVCIQSNSYLTNLHLNGNIRSVVKENDNFSVSHESSVNGVDHVDNTNGLAIKANGRDTTVHSANKKSRPVRSNYYSQNFPPKAHVYFVRRLSIVSPEDFTQRVIKETPNKSTVLPNLGQ